MSYKPIILSILLLSMLTAATAGYRWWKERAVAPIPASMPPAVSELKRLMHEYRRQADSLASVSATIRIYDREKKDSLKESNTFRYIRSGEGYYMQLSYLQTWCDGRWMVQLDTVNRHITVLKAPGTIPDAMPSLSGPLEVLFSDTARFHTGGEVIAEGSRRSLRLESELNPSIKSSTLHYDTLHYRLESADIEWWKPGTPADANNNKIWLVKIAYQYPPAAKMDIQKKIRSIVAIGGTQVTPAAAYHDYTLNVNN